jgi:hypothetical protein
MHLWEAGEGRVEVRRRTCAKRKERRSAMAVVGGPKAALLGGVADAE